MVSRFKAVIQYLVIFTLTILLVGFSLRGLNVGEGEDKWQYLKETWAIADKGWLLLMAAVSLISHLIRAERWRMLMVPAGYTPKLNHSFFSLMVGYLVNLVIPRGGELSRCYNLYKLSKTPVDLSFGTVVVERIVDLVCLIFLIILSFIFESEKLFAFIDTLPFSFADGSKFTILLYLLLAVLIFMGLFYFLLKQNKRLRAFVTKAWTGFKAGLLTVFKLKNKGRFIFYSILIWLFYFGMSYTVIKAFPSTSALGFSAVLSLFAIGAIAMAAPLPGGAGSYHVLVPQGLVFLYQLPQNDAVAFTFIFHGWQTIIMILGGAISLIITSYIVKKNQSSKTSGQDLKQNI